jgi:uncharacterized membrane protein
MQRLLHTKGVVAMYVRTPEDRAMLLHKATMIERVGRERLVAEHDQQNIAQQYERVVHILNKG